MNAIEAYERMAAIKKLWMKDGPFSEAEAKEAKGFLFQYERVLEDALMRTEITT